MDYITCHCQPSEPNARRDRPVPRRCEKTTQGAFMPDRKTTGAAGGRAEDVAAALPYLRRYARALTGRQSSGDTYAAAALEALVEDGALLTAERDAKVALFRAFHLIWASAGAPVEEADTELSRRAQGHMAGLTPNSREALLLHTIEDFRIDDIARIMQVSVEEADDLIARARDEMERAISGRVLVIEDEAIIAMDIESIVTSMGHTVTGIARTRDRAVELGRRERPDLVLADIQLADNSSGIDAVNTLLETFRDLPVIFITAFPERLLTGDRPEPAFLISKPYSEDQVRSAVSQAMFFASTETLGG
jgi:DNA-directed RNA polymerase specialized sigma24 family protein